ncbi:hypothetical protein ASA1KI_32440 [Opitutales bacterium ASA1]|uniref:hypothetical protein n=1 Tax=Congregicoccus parvus TaxID=3081749 RepID=UPI002B29837E|nr:hypothetical protein ASA1KI_32440 [Opitutales bacterium ASA1]
MKPVLKLLSYAGLALSLLPSFFVFAGTMAPATSKTIMIVGMVLWFSTALLWIKPTKPES